MARNAAEMETALERLRIERDRYLRSSVDYDNLSERLRAALDQALDDMRDGHSVCPATKEMMQAAMGISVEQCPRPLTSKEDGMMREALKASSEPGANIAVECKGTGNLCLWPECMVHGCMWTGEAEDKR
jgi:hypothetical protein